MALVVGWFAPILLVYVAVEPAILRQLPEAWYWPARLLPDALIGLLVVASLLIAGRHQPIQNIIAIGVLLIVTLITILDVARGQSASDAINGFRVVIRYLLLGLLFWLAATTDRRALDRLVGAIAIVLVVQVAGAVWQAGGWLAGGGSVQAIPALDGLTGRYDRLGLLVMAGTLVVLGLARSSRRWLLAAVPILLLILLLTTSRQAEVGLAVGCLILAILPGQILRWRAVLVVVAACALFMLLLTPSRITRVGSEDIPTAPGLGSVGTGNVKPAPASQPKGSTQLSIDPNRNFRLYLLVSLAPWAAHQEPFLGFGPGAQVAEQPEPRLAAKLNADGAAWASFRRFMNDSTYSSWIIQFGLVAPLLLLAGVVAASAALLVKVRRRDGLLPGIAIALTVAMLAAAAFGPVFETRTSSIAFWLILCGALAVGRVSSRAGVPAPSARPRPDAPI